MASPDRSADAGEPASAVVRRCFAAYATAGVEGMAALMAPDATFVVTREISVEPDTYEGREGVRRYFAGWEGMIDDVRFDLAEVEDVGPGLAIATLSFSGEGVVSRIRVAQDAILSVVVRDEAIRRMVAHRDLESARRELAGPDGAEHPAG